MWLARLRPLAILVLTIISFDPGRALAQSAKPDTPLSGDDWIRLRIADEAIYQSSSSRDEIRRKLRSHFETQNVTGTGITAANQEAVWGMLQAKGRAASLAWWFEHDLDRDGRVTRSEIEMVARHELVLASMKGPRPELIPTDIEQGVRYVVSKRMEADLNGDGTITLEEEIAHNEKQQAASAPFAERIALFGGPKLAYARMLVPLSLDANKDGVVSADEYMAAVERIFDEIDVNKDGAISPRELATIAPSMAAAPVTLPISRQLANAKLERCRIPHFLGPALPRVMLVGAYQGMAVSNVSVGDDDVEVHVAQLDIEPGTEKLFIVATTYEAMIWQVTGATDRVQMFVAVSEHDLPSPRVGVVGLPRERVFIPKSAECIRSFTSQQDDRPARSAVSSLLGGRTIASTIGSYSIGRLALPSGRLTNDAHPNARKLDLNGPAGSVWRSLLRFNPAGVVDNDPAAVVADLPVKRYDILPHHAGLAQLVESGALEIASEIRAVEVNGILIAGGEVKVEGASPKVQFVPGSYRILKKIRFPVGLSGSQSVEFELPRGVPMPDGDMEHSRLKQQ